MTPPGWMPTSSSWVSACARGRSSRSAPDYERSAGVLVDAFLEDECARHFRRRATYARFPYALAGHDGRVRVEHWVVAERLGQLAAINMLGGRQRFEQAPFFWSQHFDVAINYVGYAEKWEASEIVGDIGAHDGLVKYRNGGRVVAVASIFRDEASLRAEIDLEAVGIVE